MIADSKGAGFSFAREVCDYLKMKWGGEIFVNLIDVEMTMFKDGEFKIRVLDNIRGKKCFFIHDSNKSPCEWFSELIFTVEAMTFSSPKEINVVLPYMRFSRQDRKDESRVSVNAKVLANILSMYASRGMTVDLHTPQIQEFYDIPFDNLHSFPSLINYLRAKKPEVLENLVIVSPDLGGGKRAEGLVKRLANLGITAGIAFGHKTREKENQVDKILIIGDIKGKNCLVVDDIIDTGNTMIKTAEVLKKEGALKVYAYGTHGLFSDGVEKFGVFDRVFVSDSLKTKEALNFEVVSLVKLFGEAIYRTVAGKSLSVLFNDAKGAEQSSLKGYEI